MNKDLLATFANNEPLMKEVKSVLLEKFALDYDDLSKSGFDQLKMGQLATIAIAGRNVIETVFDDIARCKTTPTQPGTSNPAR